jgi:hypothetical protein
MQLRPVIKVILDPGGTMLMGKSFSIDLGTDLNVTITKVLSEDEVCRLISFYQKNL